MRSSIFAVLAALLVLSGASYAILFVSPNISSCMNITVPGTYNLTANLSGAPNIDPVLNGNYCIGIAAPNVTLDCNGFSIDSAGAGGNATAVLFNGSASSSVLRNCRSISNYYFGAAYMENTAQNNVTNVTVYNSTQAFSVFNSSGNTLTSNMVSNATAAAFFGIFANSTVISSNRVDTFSDGFFFTNGGSLSIANNVLTNGTSYGLLSMNLSGSLVFQGNNMAVQNTGALVASSSPLTSTLTNNVVNSSVGTGFLFQNVSGGPLTISSNQINNVSTGVVVDLLGGNLNVSSNTMPLVLSTGIVAQSVNGSATFNSNSITGASTAIVVQNVIMNPVAVNSNNINSVSSGIIVVDVVGGPVSVSTNNLQNVSSTGMMVEANVNGSRTVSSNTVVTQPTAGACVLITSNANGSTTANSNTLDNCQQALLIAGNSNGSVTANGNTIHGVTLFGIQSVDNLPGDTSISNNVIDTPVNGIFVTSGVGNVLVGSNSVQGNISGGGMGVIVAGYTNGTITASSNNVSEVGNGVYVVSNTNGSVVVSGNSILDTTSYGAFVADNSNGAFQAGGNTVRNGMFGLYLTSNSNGSMNVSGNSVTNTTQNNYFISGNTGPVSISGNSGSMAGNSGYYVISNGNATALSGNSMSGANNSGFFLAGNMNLSVVSDTAAGTLGAPGAGFDIVSNGPLPPVMAGNIAHDNNGSGFILSGNAPNATFSGDRAYNNLLPGFFLQGDSNTTLTNVTAYNNSVGLYQAGAGPLAATVVNSQFYGNGWEIQQLSPGATFNLTNTTLGSSNMVEVNLLDAITSGYSLNDTVSPGPDPSNLSHQYNGFLKLNFSSEPTIDSLGMHYFQQIQGVVVLTWNGTGWTQQNQTDDTQLFVVNMTNVTNITTDDIYGIFAPLAFTSSGGGPSGGGSMTLPLAVSFNSSSGVATVTSNGSPVPGASVKENGVLIGTTDSNGQISIPGCGENVTIDALKDGYSAASASVSLVSCTAPPACTTNSDCGSTQACVASACVTVSCPNGSVVNHQCVVQPQNQTNQTCTSPSCCTSSSACSDTQACVTPSGAPPTQAAPGSCQQVTGQCGYASNHAFVPYNYTCGTEPGCPSCPGGQSCVAHQCVQYGLSCPSGGAVGTSVTCNATANGQACPNCNYTVTDPSGASTSGQAGADGSITLPLSSAGQYKVSIMSAGAPVNSVQVAASAPSQQPAQPSAPSTAASAGPDYTWVFLLILLVIIVAGAYLYMRGKKK